MKLVILSAIWFPVTIFILLFSLSFLLRVNYKSNNTSIPAPSVLALTTMQDSYNNKVPVNKISSQDIRVLALKRFLEDYHSPLFDYADFIVKNADRWGLDYALIPSIAMQESGGCKTIPDNSYNCWGFGIYGDKITRFSSYEDAISQVTKTIKEAYIKNGLTNPTLLEDRWTPSSRGSWSYSVNYFIDKIKEIEKSISAS